MSLTTRTALIPSLVLGLVAFALDRGHKYVQIEAMGWRGGEFVPVTPFFDYVLVWNPGVSYGLLGDLPVWALGLVAVLAILGLCIWWWRTNDGLVRLGLMAAIGGAVSNALDRLLYGAVADFFHFHWGDWSFYIFNVADMAITFGVLLLLLDFLGIGRARNRESAAG